MKKFYGSILVIFVFYSVASAQVLLDGSTYSENFNSLAATGSSASVPTGWAFVETNGDGNYIANNGGSQFPNTFSYRSDFLTGEKAFGMLRRRLSATEFFSIIGASFTNNTGATIESLQIGYLGEMWRLGTVGNSDSLNFQYSLDATSIDDAAANWVDFDALDFITPDNTSPAGARDGNLTLNRTPLSSEINGLSILDGATFFIRFLDADINPTLEDGLAIDDFSLTPITPPPTEVFISNITPTSVNEGDGSATITVSINNPSATADTQVDLAFQMGTVTNGVGGDINYTTQTVTFPAGSSADQEVIVAINDDSEVEVDETMTFQLETVVGGTPTAVIISPIDVTITIVDNDFNPTEVFISNTTATSIGEGDFAAIISVGINNPSTSVDTNVDLVFTAGTVTNGAGGDIDYTTQTVTFPAGSSADQDVIVFINDDSDVEGDETMTFELQMVIGGNPTAIIVAPTDVTITIIDNDVAANLFYRSVTSGSWSDLATWETSVDGNAPWTTPAAAVPSFLDGPISILSTHDVTIDTNGGTVSGDLQVDQLTIEAGGTLTRLAGDLFLDDGSGVDLTVNGTLVHGAALGKLSFVSSTASIRVNNGGVIQVNDNTNDQSFYATNTQTSWRNNSTFFWNVDDPFASDTYFPLSAMDSNTPSFEVQNITNPVGDTNDLTIYGLLEVLSGGTLTFAGTGIKTIEGGINNGGTITQNSGSGLIQFTHNSVLRGTGSYNLDAGSGLLIASAANTTFRDNKTINGGPVTVDGTLTFASGGARTFTLTDSGPGSVGITGTGTVDISSSAHKIIIAAESPSFGTLIPGSSSTVEYSSNDLQNIAAADYANLTSSGSGDRVLPNGGTLGISSVFTPGTNSYTVTGSTIDYNGSSSQNVVEFDYFNLSSSGAGARVLPDGGTVGVAGTFTPGAGTYTTDGSTIDYNGTNQPVAGFNYESITISNSGTKTLSGAGDFIGTLTVDPGTNFDLNGQSFTLLSIAAGSGRVDALDATAAITGDMTVQRFVDGGTFFRYISVPVGDDNSADWVPVTQWQDDIIVTGSFTGSDPLFNESSLFYYDETVANISDSGYVAYPTSANTETLEPGVGYATFMFIESQDKTIDVTSPINRDNFTFNVTYTNNGLTDDDGWNLLGNPYPSAIDWSSGSWTKANVENSVYIRDAPNSTFATWVIDNMGVGVGTNGGTGRIALGQAFWIKAESAGPQLVATENIKVGGDATFFRTQQPSNLVRVTLTDSEKRDETIIRFADGATNDFDGGYDARKLYNEIFNVYTSSEDGVDLAINALASASCNSQIGLNLSNTQAGDYQLLFTENESFASTMIQLVDAFTDETIDISPNTSYDFSVTSDESSYEPGRFKLIFDSGLDPKVSVLNGNVLQSNYAGGNQWYLDGELIEGAIGSEFDAQVSGTYTLEVNLGGCVATTDFAFVITDLDDHLKQSVKVFPNPVSDLLNLEILIPNLKESPKVALYNYSGQIITEIILSSRNDSWYGSFEMNGLASGIYFVNIVTSDGVYQSKVIKE